MRCQSGGSQFLYLSTVLVNGSSTDSRPRFMRIDRLLPVGYGNVKGCRRAGLEAMGKIPT